MPPKANECILEKKYVNCHDVSFMSNGSKIDYVQQCVYLGTTIFSDISIKNIDNAVNDIYIYKN